MLYNKATDLSITAVDPAASLTLMSADIEQITTGMQTMHEIWANVFEVVLAIYLLQRQLGVACAIPIGVAISKFMLFNNCDTFMLMRFGFSSFASGVTCQYKSRDATPATLAGSYREAYHGNCSNAWCHERS